jgi:molybdopterin-guanine dinucleotide biosynthesis protein A
MVQAREWSDLVAVAARNAAQVEPIEDPFIADAPNVAGPLAGLIAALRFGAEAGRAFILTIPADMPFLPGDLLDRLVLEIGERSCALASSGGHVHPVCGLWRTSALDRIDEYLAGERRSLRGFAELVGYAAVEWPSDPFDPFFNVNSPEDLAEAERRVRSEVEDLDGLSPG